ncbi:hypothetical protein [uncultured Bacteroides sp.]|uniref:hypothetical protein n=1 Tax=uncultured Bacteroides sp. TaxID=162156 RepID=UPI002613F07C|nr:hypothetical protein [uncultured Bacteroides sp.]
MAIFIKTLPTLEGKVADRFYKKAAQAESKRASVDFSREVQMTRAILAKSKASKKS